MTSNTPEEIELLARGSGLKGPADAWTILRSAIATAIRDAVASDRAAIPEPQSAASGNDVQRSASLTDDQIDRINRESRRTPGISVDESLRRFARACIAADRAANSLAAPEAHWFRFHTDDSLAGKPNVRSWMLCPGAPSPGLYEEGEVRLLYAATPSVGAGAAESPEPESWREAVAKAYAVLWCINNEPGTPNLYPPEKGAYAARKLLRDLLTTEERGRAINAAIACGCRPGECESKPAPLRCRMADEIGDRSAQ